ncbi:MAG: hypothetical protein CMF39_00260 [Legionellaceae bacterium]|nr:hypothetical protein [Legionellaceae bacterium]
MLSPPIQSGATAEKHGGPYALQLNMGIINQVLTDFLQRLTISPVLFSTISPTALLKSYSSMLNKHAVKRLRLLPDRVARFSPSWETLSV